ncbi:MAG: DUF6644 family protein [Bryobacteraceae bacterium]|jgi:hypothetical protein
MSITGWMDWLSNTPFSVYIRESLWGYPIIETVHVLGLCLFLGFTVLLDLRLLGVAMKRTPASEVCGRLEPWMVGGFVVMIVSGALLFYGDPVKFYGSIFMRVKFAMLLLAGLNVLIFKSSTYRKVHDWDLSEPTPRGAKVAAGLSLTLWFGIVAAGRAIAYFLPPS